MGTEVANNPHQVMCFQSTHQNGNCYLLSILAWDDRIEEYYYVIDSEVVTGSEIENKIIDASRFIKEDQDVDSSRLWELYGLCSVIEEFVIRYLGE